ncbi:hypothetical protein BC826DRAFT_1187324 [Russula brevipes]|nr:hypothetical protein BC826DRAFT_1187324 [Russula brevipes]
MSGTTQAVKNAAAALKKAADPWNKEDRETAERIVSAAISLTDTTSLDQGVLDMLSGLLRRPFAELYLSHSGTALRLSAALFTTIVHDRIAQSRKARDSQGIRSWEHLTASSRITWKLTATVGNSFDAEIIDHSSSPPDRVKTAVAQAFYAVICAAFFSATPPIPVSTHSVTLRVSAYSLLSLTADGCFENKNKLRDSRLLGGAKLGRAITLTKDYLALEQLLILLAYLLPPIDAREGGRAERVGFLRDCFSDSTKSGKDLIELLKYVASPEWEITSDKIVDILARDISVAQPFMMKIFTLNGSSLRLSPANRFYLDRTSDGKIEEMHVPYDSIRQVDISSSGTVVAQLASPPQSHETLRVISNGIVIKMTIVIPPKDVEHFIRTLRIRGMTSRLKLDGMRIRQATERTSVNISPTRLEFQSSAQGITSYESRVKVIEEGVLQASDPGDDIVPHFDVSIDKMQHESPLLVKECPSLPDLPSVPAPVITQGTKVDHDGGRDHGPSASRHQLSSVHEDSQKCPATPSLAPGPPLSPRGTDPPLLRSPRASGTPYSCHNGDRVSPAHSSSSGHSYHGHPSDKDLSDAIFGASDEELSSLSDTEPFICTVAPSAESIQSQRDNSKRRSRSRSQRHRHSRLSARPTFPASDLTQTQDPSPEQKLVPMVKGLRVMDSQEAARDKSSNTATKRKKIVLESEDEMEDANHDLPVVKESSPMPPNLVLEKRVSPIKDYSTITTTERSGAALERPGRARGSTGSPTVRAAVESKSKPLTILDQSGPNDVNAEEVNGGSNGGSSSSLNDRSRKRTPGEVVDEGQGAIRTAELTHKPLDTKGDIQVTSPEHGPPRKRARREPENVPVPHKRPHTRKKGPSTSQPRVPSRVRKTYKNRRKKESSPGHYVNRDIDYDEIPPSTAVLNSPSAKGCTFPLTKAGDIPPASRTLRMKGGGRKTIQTSFPTIGLGPVDEDEMPNSKRRKKQKSNQADPCPIQVPPAAAVLDDEDPIRSFSSPPSELLSLAVDAVKSEPQVLDIFGADVHSDCPAEPDSLVKSLNITPTTATTRRMIAETPSDVTSQPIACDTMSRPSIPEDAGTSAEILFTSFPATTNNKAQGSSMAPTDLNYLDGPTIIDEPSESLQAEKSIAISKPAVEVIDLTDTPSPMPSAREAEKIASSPNVPTSSPSSPKGRTSDDITDTSVLDLADAKYRDFVVPLDSSFCLPSIKPSRLTRAPTPPPPPRTKSKNVTFAAPLEEVLEERPGIQKSPAEVVAPPTMNDSDDCMELAPELARYEGSPSPVGGSNYRRGKRPIVEPHSTPPSPHPASRLSMTVEPPSLFSSSLPLRQSRSYLTEAPLFTAAYTKQKTRARNTSPSPSITAESSYLSSIMAVLDEIHAIIKGNVQARFERLNGHTVKLRELILAQTRADLTALLDKYITVFNNLVSLEAKYGAFSGRRIATLSRARDANAQDLASLRARIQTHDRVMQVHARHSFTVRPLPDSIRRWL